jgi:hypothetical protein
MWLGRGPMKDILDKQPAASLRADHFLIRLMTADVYRKTLLQIWLGCHLFSLSTYLV